MHHTSERPEVRGYAGSDFKDIQAAAIVLERSLHEALRPEAIFKQMRNPLPLKEVKTYFPYQARVLTFDPTDIFSRVQIDNTKRHPWFLMEHLFPPLDKVCGCGCAQVLTGRRTRWATEECQKFVSAVFFIIKGDTTVIRRYLQYYYGDNCFSCDAQDSWHDLKNGGAISNIKVDHIIPVKHGGGGGWLTNYQLLCHQCHVKKTNEDFNYKKSKIDNAARI